MRKAAGNGRAAAMIKRYYSPKVEVPPVADGNWSKSPWPAVPTLRLAEPMGRKPDYELNCEARVAWSRAALHVIFRVEDRYVRAVAARHEDPVYQDSCVEFFFTPGPDVSMGYFNLETNCGGTMLFHFQKAPRQGVVPVSPRDRGRIRLAHSLPKIVEQELIEPVCWVVEYSVPFCVLEKYCPFVPPKPGVEWRVNFYKCADKSSHPHWLTWSPVAHPSPNFHLPEYFGVLEFGDLPARGQADSVRP